MLGWMSTFTLSDLREVFTSFELNNGASLELVDAHERDGSLIGMLRLCVFDTSHGETMLRDIVESEVELVPAEIVSQPERVRAYFAAMKLGAAALDRPLLRLDRILGSDRDDDVVSVLADVATFSSQDFEPLFACGGPTRLLAAKLESESPSAVLRARLEAQIDAILPEMKEFVRRRRYRNEGDHALAAAVKRQFGRTTITFAALARAKAAVVSDAMMALFAAPERGGAALTQVDVGTVHAADKHVAIGDPFGDRATIEIDGEQGDVRVRLVLDPAREEVAALRIDLVRTEIDVVLWRKTQERFGVEARVVCVASASVFEDRGAELQTLERGRPTIHTLGGGADVAVFTAGTRDDSPFDVLEGLDESGRVVSLGVDFMNVFMDETDDAEEEQSEIVHRVPSHVEEAGSPVIEAIGNIMRLTASGVRSNYSDPVVAGGTAWIGGAYYGDGGIKHFYAAVAGPGAGRVIVEDQGQLPKMFAGADGELWAIVNDDESRNVFRRVGGEVRHVTSTFVGDPLWVDGEVLVVLAAMGSNAKPDRVLRHDLSTGKRWIKKLPYPSQATLLRNASGIHAFAKGRHRLLSAMGDVLRERTLDLAGLDITPITLAFDGVSTAVATRVGESDDPFVPTTLYWLDIDAGGRVARTALAEGTFANLAAKTSDDGAVLVRFVGGGDNGWLVLRDRTIVDSVRSTEHGYVDASGRLVMDLGRSGSWILSGLVPLGPEVVASVYGSGDALYVGRVPIA